MGTFGTQDSTGLYGGERLLRGGKDSEFSLTEKEFRTLKKGSPKKYFAQENRGSVRCSLLISLLVGFPLWILFILIYMIRTGGRNVADVESAYLIYGICAFAVLLLSVVIFLGMYFSAKKKVPSTFEGTMRNGELYLDTSKALHGALLFGQNEYDEEEAKRAKNGIYRLGFPVLGMLFSVLLGASIACYYAVSNSRDVDTIINMSIWFGFASSFSVAMLQSMLWLMYFHLGKYDAAEAVCPHCRYLHTFVHDGVTQSHSQELEWKTGSTKGREVQTGSVYASDGTRLGGVYTWSSGEDFYESGIFTEETHRLLCAKCGFVAFADMHHYQKTGERSVLNGK